MPRKPFEALAGALSVVRAGSAHHPALTGPQRSAAGAAVERCAEEIASACRADNGAFGRERFMRAAGF